MTPSEQRISVSFSSCFKRNLAEEAGRRILCLRSLSFRITFGSWLPSTCTGHLLTSQVEEGGREEGGSTDLEPSKSSSSAAEEEGSEVSFLREEDLDLCFLTRVKMYFWLQCVQVTFWPICGGVEFLLTQDPFRSYFSLMTSSSGLRKMLFVTKK
jgi:hypothetical protein